MIRAGQLKKRVTLQKKTISTNSFGEQTESWSDLATVWAEKKLLTTKDITRNQGQVAQSEIKFLIRNRSDITLDMRLTYKGHSYYVTGVEELLDETGLFLFVRKST